MKCQKQGGHENLDCVEGLVSSGKGLKEVRGITEHISEGRIFLAGRRASAKAHRGQARRQREWLERGMRNKVGDEVREATGRESDPPGFIGLVL